MKSRTLSLATMLLVLFSFSLCFAGWDKKPEFRWTQLYRYDSREDNHQLYINRLSCTFDYLNEAKESLFKITPFGEFRRNVDRDVWERKEAGVEVGKDIFSWLYLGDEIRYDWMNEDYHYPGVYVKRSYMASEPILCLSHQLLSYKGFNLKGFVRDEYTYDFKDGAGIRNDVVIGLIMPIGKYVETGISWRHIDRVHYYDSDTFEGTVTLVF